MGNHTVVKPQVSRSQVTRTPLWFLVLLFSLASDFLVLSTVPFSLLSDKYFFKHLLRARNCFQSWGDGRDQDKGPALTMLPLPLRETDHKGTRKGNAVMSEGVEWGGEKYTGLGGKWNVPRVERSVTSGKASTAR